MFKFAKKYRSLLFILLFLGLIIFISTSVSSQEIVGFVGMENTYLVAFLLAIFGGLSTITGVSFFVSVATFVAGGANPFLLAITGGLGIFISDSIFFFIANYGVQAFRKELEPFSRWLASNMQDFSQKSILVIVFIYIGLTPLPNDILMLALAFLRIPFKRLAPVLMLGSFTIVFMASYFGDKILWWL